MEEMIEVKMELLDLDGTILEEVEGELPKELAEEILQDFITK